MTIDLNYKLYGQGEPLIILHGLFGSLDNWATIGRNLGDHFMTYLIDQRDHGKSPHSNAFNYEVLAEDLRHFMEENWIHSSHIIGHSMGGKTAMKFALENNEMVEKLIILDMAPKGYSNRHQLVFDAIKAVDLDNMKHRKDARELLLDKLDGDAATTAFLLKNIKRDKEGTFSWKMNVELLAKDYENIIAPMPTEKVFEGETLFIRGGNSQYILDEDTELITKLFPHAQIQTLEDTGHWLHAEKPTELMQMIQNFID